MRARSMLFACAWLVGCGLRVQALDERGDAAVTNDGGVDQDSIATDGVASETLPTGTGEAISAGQYHVCAIHQGVLSCWGEGKQGKLGNGDTNNRLNATPIALSRAWKSVSAGEDHTCALTEEGDVWCWGANESGQLGLGDTNPRLVPERVPLAKAAVQVSAGFRFACAILTDATLWCWGENVEGELAQGDGYPGMPALKPVRVGSDADWMWVAGGQGHGCGIRAPGSLWCWGRNSDGELAQGDGAPVQLRVPTRVGATSDWVDVDCGQSTTCGIRMDGSLWCWGGNSFGQAGAAPSSAITTPKQTGPSQFVAVETDTFDTCARDRVGEIFCMGRNVEGQLGVGDTTDRSSPTKVGSDVDWAHATVGRFHTCARKTGGTFFCTGANESGELGLGDTARRNVLTKVAVP